MTGATSRLRSLGATMKAVRFHGRENLRLDELPVPDPQPGEVRIRPLATGVCGTDAHIFHGEFPANSPRVLGHEIAGLVEAVGTGVKDFREGDFVTVQPNTYCGACRYCRRSPQSPDGNAGDSYLSRSRKRFKRRTHKCSHIATSDPKTGKTVTKPRHLQSA